MADIRILYICDMKKDCCNSPTCGRNWPDGCFHTSDITHARNFESISLSYDGSGTTDIYSEMPENIPENIRNTYRDLKETYENHKEECERIRNDANRKGQKNEP
jgi:hypothetical protein